MLCALVASLALSETKQLFSVFAPGEFRKITQVLEPSIYMTIIDAMLTEYGY